MNTVTSRWVITGAGFLLIFLSGFWLSRSGKPYGMALFSAHKLIALGVVIFLGVLAYRAFQQAPFQSVQALAIAVTGLCFAATIITGGLLSTGQDMPLFVHRLHQVMPFLTLISSGATLYLLLLPGGGLSPA